jgi:hypothetical protein
MRDNHMQGSRPGPETPPSRSHGKGRICDLPGCGTTLSVYNPATRCWQHAELIFPVYRGKRLNPKTA